MISICMEKNPNSDITRRSKYFFFLGVLFVAVLMISNTATTKIIQLGPLSLPGGIILFPVSYIFGDILTEVYGYKAARKIVWSGFIALVLMAFVYWIVERLPAAPYWGNQAAYEAILGTVPRIVLGSITGYLVGEFSNSYVLSRMKVWSGGKHLWVRTIGSTVVGEAVDSVFFNLVAFLGVLPFGALLGIALSGYIVKVAYEVIATPITYRVVHWLKRTEQMDIYDRGIDYNPFILKE